MPITIKNIDLFDSKADIIAHQVNCCGIMGAGVAKQIKERYPKAFHDYLIYCERMSYSPDLLLGDVRFSEGYRFEDGTKCLFEIAHIFAQKSFGRRGIHTDYDALRKGLLRIRTYVELAGYKYVAIPYKIGCGLGGGDWENVVYPMIEDIFNGCKFDLIICRKD